MNLLFINLEGQSVYKVIVYADCHSLSFKFSQAYGGFIKQSACFLLYKTRAAIMSVSEIKNMQI